MGTVADTSAVIGAWHMHYPPEMEGFWDFFDQAWAAGRIVVPLPVYDELAEQSEGAFEWVKQRKDRVVVPSVEVQDAVGDLMDRFSFKPGRDGADPFVIVEAMVRQFSVATYEGRSPTGTTARARAGTDNIPTICSAVGVRALSPARAWIEEGLTF